MSPHLSRAALGAGMLVLATAFRGQAQIPRSGSTTSAVGRLGLDNPAPQPTVVGRTRELRCRGKPGIALQVERDPSARDPKQVAMVLRYDRPQRTRSVGQEGMGTVDYGMTIANLPGTCSWNPTGSSDVPPEPGIVYFDVQRDAQAWAPPGSRDTTIDAAVDFPDVASVTRYLNAPDRFWIFYVDDVTDISISYRAWGTLSPGSAGTGSLSTDHSFTTSRDQRTSDAGTVSAASGAAGAAGSVHDASPDRAAERPTTISVTPVSDSTGSPPPPGDTSSASRGTPEPREGRTGRGERATRQARLASGVRDVSAAPGPRGVTLSFQTARRARVRVQFSKEPPHWNGREGRWGYDGGWGGPWFASIERASGTTGYVAVPLYALETGARYHYLITLLADGESPERQRTGTFTARVGR
jgi:hypothetical protein